MMNRRLARTVDSYGSQPLRRSERCASYELYTPHRVEMSDLAAYSQAQGQS